MDAMTKMWVSLFGIGMMAIAALLITFARLKTKGVVKFVLIAACLLRSNYRIYLRTYIHYLAFYIRDGNR